LPKKSAKLSPSNSSNSFSLLVYNIIPSPFITNTLKSFFNNTSLILLWDSFLTSPGTNHTWPFLKSFLNSFIIFVKYNSISIFSKLSNLNSDSLNEWYSSGLCDFSNWNILIVLNFFNKFSGVAVISPTLKTLGFLSQLFK